MSLNITVSFPDSIADSLHATKDEFEKYAKTAMFVKLFELKKISSGMAAASLGIDRVAFLYLLHQYQVSMIDLSEEELINDINNA